MGGGGGVFGGDGFSMRQNSRDEPRSGGGGGGGGAFGGSEGFSLSTPQSDPPRSGGVFGGDGFSMSSNTGSRDDSVGGGGRVFGGEGFSMGMSDHRDEREDSIGLTVPMGDRSGGGMKSPVSSVTAPIDLTPIQFVLRNVFLRFVKAAEAKVNGLIYQTLDRELDLYAFIRRGSDPSFDSLLESVGAIAKHCPKLMIDSIMVWRKSKSEGAGNDGLRYIASVYPNLKGKDVEGVVRERKSLVANFMLCRVLIEIIQRLTKETMPNDLGEKLEDMVFGQLRNADPDLTSRSPNRQANVDLFAELIGALSNVRFETVSDRFISELRASPNLKENKLELLIR
ncbi:Cell morphogenesis protein PAG1, partial [Rhizophlyctis rosea]